MALLKSVEIISVQMLNHRCRADKSYVVFSDNANRSSWYLSYELGMEQFKSNHKSPFFSFVFINRNSRIGIEVDGKDGGRQ